MPTAEGKQTATLEGLALSLGQLRARIEQRRQAAWQPEPGETAQERRKHWQEVGRSLAQKIADGEYIGDEHLPQLRDDPAMTSLGREFLKAARRGNPQIIAAFIEEGFPVNYQSPLSGQTVLHITAATKARKALRVLVGSGRCDYLLRDNEGRMASELAYLFGEDSAVTRWLRIHERRQANARGIRLTRRPISP
jgi:hypothetical protein